MFIRTLRTEILEDVMIYLDGEAGQAGVWSSPATVTCTSPSSFASHTNRPYSERFSAEEN